MAGIENIERSTSVNRPRTAATLPTELWTEVFSNLQYQDLKAVGRVSATFRGILELKQFDKGLFRSNPTGSSNFDEKEAPTPHPVLDDIVIRGKIYRSATATPATYGSETVGRVTIESITVETQPTSTKRRRFYDVQLKNEYITSPSMEKIGILIFGDVVSDIPIKASRGDVQTVVAEVCANIRKFALVELCSHTRSCDFIIRGLPLFLDDATVACSIEHLPLQYSENCGAEEYGVCDMIYRAGLDMNTEI